MKHKHYDLIVASVANMDLVMFVKLDNHGGEWVESTVNPSIPWCEGSEYFLCLPQHKEACLHWLNGGEVEFEFLPDGCGEFGLAAPLSEAGWVIDHVFMDDQLIRIKPKKEKRVIGVHKDGRTTSHYAIDDEGCYATDEIRITGKGNPDEWQFIEIEVEV